MFNSCEMGALRKTTQFRDCAKIGQAVIFYLLQNFIEITAAILCMCA